MSDSQRVNSNHTSSVQMHNYNDNQMNFSRNRIYDEENEYQFNRVIPNRINFSRINQNNYIHASEYENQYIPRSTYLKRLKQIPSFNGDSYKELKTFITKADTLYYSTANNIERKEFFEQITFQLGEEPQNLLIHFNNPSWETIKKKLLQHYSYLSNKEILTSQIENLHQEKEESLSKYVERIRQLLRDRNSTCGTISEDLRKEHDRIARRAFINGLKDKKLRNIMIIRGSRSLKDAISHALEAENDAFSRIPENKLYCRFCGIVGHRESFCRRKNSKENSLQSFISTLQSINNFNRELNTDWNRNFNRNYDFNQSSNKNTNWLFVPNYNWNQNWNNNFNRNHPRNWDNKHLYNFINNRFRNNYFQKRKQNCQTQRSINFANFYKNKSLSDSY